MPVCLFFVGEGGGRGLFVCLFVCLFAAVLFYVVVVVVLVGVFSSFFFFPFWCRSVVFV